MFEQQLKVKARHLVLPYFQFAFFTCICLQSRVCHRLSIHSPCPEPACSRHKLHASRLVQQPHPPPLPSPPFSSPPLICLLPILSPSQPHSVLYKQKQRCSTSTNSPHRDAGTSTSTTSPISSPCVRTQRQTCKRPFPPCCCCGMRRECS